jgi:hypothetical protein
LGLGWGCAVAVLWCSFLLGVGGGRGGHFDGLLAHLMGLVEIWLGELREDLMVFWLRGVELGVAVRLLMHLCLRSRFGVHDLGI